MLQASDLEAVRRDLDGEGRDALVARRVRVRHGEDGDHAGHAAVRDEPLRPREVVAVAFANRARPEGRRVGAGIGLGEGERGEHRPGGELREETCLLFVRPGEKQGFRAQVVDHQDQARGRARAGDLLDRDAHGEQVRFQAAVLRRERQRQNVLARKELPDVLRELAGPVDLRCPRRDPLVRQLAQRVPQEDLLLGQSVGGSQGVSHARILVGHGRPRAPLQRPPVPGLAVRPRRS